MKWFRFYHEFMDDPKIAMMSDSDQLLWVKALCLANESSTRGLILLSDEEICWKLRITSETWQHAMDKFRAKGMIEHCTKGYKITNWSKRQFESDSSANRVAKHRKKKAKKRLETETKQACNVTETEAKQKSNPLRTDPEQIQITDTEQKKAVESRFPTPVKTVRNSAMSHYEEGPQQSSPWVRGRSGFDQGFISYLAKNQFSNYEGEQAKIKACSMIGWAESDRADDSEKARLRSLWDLYQSSPKSTSSETGQIRKATTAKSGFWNSSEGKSFEQHIAKCIKGGRFEFVVVTEIRKKTITYKPDGKGRGVTERHSSYHQYEEAIA